ncbi:MAG TPA: hypothetical protein VKK79_26230 [Candidatus Lokiarchaeia archaeon]|nr:hypothetical protein [Candidatus Lokiarchaeia archaeon]
MSLSFPIQHRSLAPPFPTQYEAIFGTPFTGMPVIEVVASLQGAGGNWSLPTTFLLDTGASISLLPDVLMETLGISEYFEFDFYGVVERKECKVPAKIARVVARLEDDDGNQSPEFPLAAAFASVHTPYPLLGMKNCLELFTIHLDFKAGQVTLDWGGFNQNKVEE